MNTDSETTTKNPFLNFKAHRLLLVGFLIFLAIGFALGLVSIFSELKLEDPILNPIIYTLTFILLSLWTIQYLRQLQINVKCLLGHLPRNYSWLPTLGIVVAIFFFSLGSAHLLSYALSFAPPTLVDLLLNPKTFLSQSETFAPVLYNFLTILVLLIVAPMTEELIFRGILLHVWTAKWGVTPALLTSTLLFSVFHPNVIGLFVFGLMMGLLYIKTRTLIVPIVCHGLNNLAAVGLALASQSYGTSGTVNTVDTIEKLRSHWWVGLVYIVLSAPWLITFIYKNWPKQPWCVPYLMNLAQYR